MTDPALLPVLLAITALAGMIHGTAGFGFVLVAAPLMVIFIEPRIAVPVIIVQTLLMSFPILLHAFRYLRPKRMWMLAVSGVAGVPAGTFMLTGTDATFLQVLTGVVAGAAGVAMLFGFKYVFPREQVVSVPVGFSSGFLGASTGLAGPPVLLFYANQGLNAQEFRANLVAHFALMDVAILPGFYFNGLFGSEVIRLSAWLLPATLIGAMAGIALSGRLDDIAFHRIALVATIAAGIGAAVSGVLRLW